MILTHVDISVDGVGEAPSTKKTRLHRPVMNNTDCVNQVNLLGRVGQDAEYRGSESHPVVLFSVATNVSYTRQDGELYTRTDWHRISVFRPFIRDKVAANLRKGDRVYVTGQIQYDEYRDRNDVMQRSTSIIAGEIINLTRKFLNEKDNM